MSDLIDVMIPLGPRESGTAGIAVRSVRAYVSDVRNIYVVSAHNPGIQGAIFVDERTFPFSIEAVQEIVGTRQRSGWYLQQLLKLYFPFVRSDALARVLVVDADTIFLRPCRFIQDNRVILNFGDEHHPPYFEHMARLDPKLRRMFAYSGITHCMLFERAWLAELHKRVEDRHGQLPFWRIFLEAVDSAHAEHSGASEYEIYFHYCLMAHAKELILRRFHWHNGASVEDVLPDRYEYVSLHSYLQKEPIDQQELERRAFPQWATPRS